MADTLPPLDAGRLRDALCEPAGPWRSVDVVAESTSTNAELAAAGGGGRLLFAERQTAGRGRLGRSWTTPVRTAVLMSASFAFDVPAARATWLPLVAGLSCVDVLRSRGVPARAKWPNDVLLPEPDGPDLPGWGRARKVAGVLVQAVPGGAVIGIGVNVDQGRSELPVPSATSLSLAGYPTDRTSLALDLARTLYDAVQRWSAADGDPGPLAGRYAQVLATLGSRVAVDRVDGSTLSGTAIGLGPDGALLVRDEAGADHRVTGGDVRHLRSSGDSH